MKSEIPLNTLILLSSILLALHCFARRGKRTTVLCLLMGLGFGVFFPMSHVLIFRSYSFHFRYQILGLPPFLPLFWWCAFYISLWLSERVAGSLNLVMRKPVFTAVLAGLAMLVMEIIWDDLAVRSGVLSFQNMSYLWYRPSFHSGIAPQINAAHFVFAYVYVYTIERLEPLSEVTSLARLVIVGLLMMLSLFLVGLYFEILRFGALDAWLTQTTALIADLGVSLVTTILCTLQTPWLFAALGRVILREASE